MRATSGRGRRASDQEANGYNGGECVNGGGGSGGGTFPVTNRNRQKEGGKDTPEGEGKEGERQWQ